MRLCTLLCAAALFAALATSHPIAQEQPAQPRNHGEPLDLALPEAIRKQMEDQAVAITRMRLYFGEGTGRQDGIALEFEDMRTEVPVIFAAFVAERSDKVLSFDDWQAREDRYVDLGVQVKSLPKSLKGMKVQIEHTHLQGETETLVSTFDVPLPEGDKPFDDLRIRGAKPGLNRYRLVVQYTNAGGETSTHRGFSHWVAVQAPPMFEFSHTAAVNAFSRDHGEAKLLEVDARFDAAFLLHHGIKAEDCLIRVLRRGHRDMELSALSPGLRRVIERERAPMGWHVLGRTALVESRLPGLAVAIEGSFVRLSFRHVLNTSTAALPLDEDWEYRFELVHKAMSEPMATWLAKVQLKLDDTAGVSAARVRVDGTGLPEVMQVPFKNR